MKGWVRDFLSPVGWALVAQGGLGAGVGFAVGLAFDQRPDAAGHRVEGFCLLGDNIGQILDRAGEVGDFFFEMRGVFGHGPTMARRRPGVNAGFCGGFLPLWRAWARPRATVSGPDP